MLRFRSEQGFTLVEMLVVVFILAVFAGLAYPHLNSIVDSSTKVECQSRLELIRRVKSSWVVDHLGVSQSGEIPTSRLRFSMNTSSGASAADQAAFKALFPERFLFECPRAPSSTTSADKKYLDVYRLYRVSSCPYCDSHP